MYARNVGRKLLSFPIWIYLWKKNFPEGLSDVAVRSFWHKMLNSRNKSSIVVCRVRFCIVLVISNKILLPDTLSRSPLPAGVHTGNTGNTEKKTGIGQG